MNKTIDRKQRPSILRQKLIGTREVQKMISAHVDAQEQRPLGTKGSPATNTKPKTAAGAPRRNPSELKPSTLSTSTPRNRHRSTNIQSPPKPSTVSDLIAQAKQNPLHWIVPNVVLEDGVHVIHGAEESFKTMLTLQLHEAMSLGGKFLLRDVKGGLTTGIVELEMKGRQFGNRLSKFFPNGAPDIRVLSEAQRLSILAKRQAKDRIKVIADWAESQELQFISIDSAVKLFPAGCDLSSADLASDIFNQLQRLTTVWIIAHDRKPQPGIVSKAGNAEIVGSGRFAQDPDVIHQMIRPDGRAPRVDFHWGKMREGEKFDSIPLYFDSVDYRLYPLHPYLHLLLKRPMIGTKLVAEAERRFGWKERQAREYLASLGRLVDVNGNPCVKETTKGHNKLYTMIGVPTAALEDPRDLVQGCSNTKGLDGQIPKMDGQNAVEALFHE